MGGYLPNNPRSEHRTVDLDDFWNFSLPTEYVSGTSRPTVDVVPTIYCLTSDSATALITGRDTRCSGEKISKHWLKPAFP